MFRGLEVIARPGVFVPRDSTEFLAEQAIRRLRRRRDPVAVDLACGGGTVGLAIAAEVPGSHVYGTDISADAIQVARLNARRLELANARFLTGDLFGALPQRLRGTVDTIALHPPYVAKRELRELPMRSAASSRCTPSPDTAPTGSGSLEGPRPSPVRG